MAYREVKHELVGKGCMLQGVALLLPFIGAALAGTVGGALGLIAALVLFIAGHSKGQVFICSDCRNPLASDEVKVCPVCKARLE